MDRLKEPSTWAGIAGIAGTVAHWLPGQAGFIVGGLAVLAGSLAGYLREGSNA